MLPLRKKKTTLPLRYRRRRFYRYGKEILPIPKQDDLAVTEAGRSCRYGSKTILPLRKQDDLAVTKTKQTDFCRHRSNKKTRARTRARSCETHAPEKAADITHCIRRYGREEKEKKASLTHTRQATETTYDGSRLYPFRWTRPTRQRETEQPKQCGEMSRSNRALLEEIKKRKQEEPEEGGEKKKENKEDKTTEVFYKSPGRVSSVRQLPRPRLASCPFPSSPLSPPSPSSPPSLSREPPPTVPLHNPPPPLPAVNAAMIMIYITMG